MYGKLCCVLIKQCFTRKQLNALTAHGSTYEAAQVRLLGQVAVLAAEHAQVGGVISEKAQLPILFTAAVTEVGVALRAGHVITAVHPLDVDLKKKNR